MAFYRRRPRPDAEKCADPAKARASALETLAGQEISANMLYERLCRRYTEQAAAAAVAEMVQLDYVRPGGRRRPGAGGRRRVGGQPLRKKLAIGRRDLVVAALQRRGFAYPVIKEAIRRVEEGE